MPKLTFCDDKSVEDRLREFETPFTIKTVKLSEIDRKAGLVNKARIIKPIMDDVVQEYALAMERGDTFPRPLLATVKGAVLPYYTLGGNHRIEAADLFGVKELECYVVTTQDPMVLDLLPRSLNRAHGAKSSRDELIMHALHAMDAHGLTAKQAAELFGLKPEILNYERRRRTVREVLDRHGVKHADLKAAVIEKLHKLSANENVLAAAAAISIGLSTEDVGTLVADVLKKKSEASQLGIVAEHKARHALPGPPQKLPRQIRTMVLNALSSLENIVLGKREPFKNAIINLAQVQITDERECDAVRKRLLRVAGQLTKIAKARNASGG